MSREIISPEGLRQDGRRANEVRRVTCELGVFPAADGSAVYEQGNTKVFVAVYGPREVKKRHDAQPDRCIVKCEFSMMPFATSERKSWNKGDRRSKETALLIKQTFEAVILTHLLPRSEISINVQVVQADGGSVCAAINATSLALINAGIPMKELITACTAGYVDSTPLLDVNFTEKSGQVPLLKVAVHPKSGRMSLVQLDSKLALENMEDVMNLAVLGAKQISDVLKEKVETYSQAILHSRGMLNQ